MNKNVYLFLMIFSFFFNGKVMGTAWDGISSDTKWYDEAKTEFQISSAAQLKGLADLVNNSGLTFEGKKIMLDNDIDLNNKLWTPIGNGNYANCDKVFKGVFDGCGHKISNVSIKNTTNPYGNIGLSNYYSIGFFGVVEEGLITRVRIDGEVTIEEGYSCGSAGGLVGYAINCTMEKICASFKLNVKVSTSDFYLGGVAGYAVTSSFFVVASSGEALFYNSVYMGPQSYFGGVAALAQSLKECSSDFKIVILTNVPTSSCHIGGLAGYAKSVSNAIFSGSIKIDDYWNRQNVFMGGVVGQAGSEISNVISAPSFFFLQTNMPALFQGMIVPNGGAGSSSIVNAWYLSGITSNPGSKGTSISESELKSGKPIDGFNTEIWSFNEGEYPSLIKLSDLEFVGDDDEIDEYGRIDGVYYEFDEAMLTAKVVSGDIKYSGDIVIKESIVRGGKKYLVTSIGDRAFLRCDNLISVVLPNSVTCIGQAAFDVCKGLKSITLSENLETIGIAAFAGCEQLTAINIPNTVTTIGDLAFSDCRGLTIVRLPNEITTIPQGLFWNCISLASIIIPMSVNNFEYNNAFNGCSGLESIMVEDGNRKYDSRNNCNAIIETSTNKLIRGCNTTIIPHSIITIGENAFYGSSSLAEIAIPNSVVTIGTDAFSECHSLSIVEIPNSVTEILPGAFNGCTSLESIELPNSIVRMEGAVFQGCSSLVSVKLPENLKKIESSSFAHCVNLRIVTLPNSVEEVSGYSFYNCPSLEKVCCYAENVPTAYDAFKESPIQNATLYVKAESLEKYKKVEPWCNFGEIYSIGKCSEPSIRYLGGELSFSCETEGAEFNYDVKDEDVRSGVGEIIRLTATYEVSVYASKFGYENSDVVKAVLCWIDQQPETEGIISDVEKILSKPVLIQNNGGVLTIKGLAEHTPVSIYGINGSQVGSAIGRNGEASFATGLKPGTIVILKIGDNSMKIALK